MKYLKLFENFKSHFDYNIDQIREILTLRGTKFNNIEFIANGRYGSAFDLNNGLVLKITTMDSELYYAKKLMNIDSDFLVKIEDVFYHQYSDIKNGFIVMEKLQTNISQSFKYFIDYTNKYGSISSIWKSITNDKVLEYFRPKLISLNDEIILRYWDLYKQIRMECEKYNLPTDDLSSHNVGIRNNKPVFFDIGDIYNTWV